MLEFRNLGNFDTNLIQKNISMFMTLERCMSDLVTSKLTNIILIMDSNTENRKWVATIAYPTAPKPFPLVDIEFVDVFVPFNAVHKGCNVFTTTFGRSSQAVRK